ncbi:hypothetical protein HispidOSU_015045, partial [Sigmodon hispidus]
LLTPRRGFRLSVEGSELDLGTSSMKLIQLLLWSGKESNKSACNRSPELLCGNWSQEKRTPFDRQWTKIEFLRPTQFPVWFSAG